MPTYGSGNNTKYLVHIIAVLRLVKQKGTAAKVKEAFAALVKVRKKINKLKESLKAKKTLLLNWPRRLTSCSVASLSGRREHNGTGL